MICHPLNYRGKVIKKKFLYVDDLADDSICTRKQLSDHIYNVGSGVDYTIKEISEKINSIVKYG